MSYFLGNAIEWRRQFNRLQADASGGQDTPRRAGRPQVGSRRAYKVESGVSRILFQGLGKYMNCFAHAFPFLEDPYFVVGACLPDWMAVINRKVRFRSHRIAPWVEDADLRTRSLFSGVQQHLNDDQWFHGTSIFVELNLKLSKRLACFESDISSLQSNFVAHIAIEMLVDNELSERYPGKLEYYYEQLRKVDAMWLQAQLEEFAIDREVAYVQFHRRFLEARFLFDYASDDRMLFRLNQVMGRTQLPPLGAQTQQWIPEARRAVRTHFRDLLNAYHFNLVS